MFISGRILDWDYYTEDGVGLLDEEDDLFYRAHDIWRHASTLVTNDCSEFELSDAISNLKRAVNHRLKALSRAYSFDALPFSNRRQTIEKFQFYGIIRPTLLKELFQVRNSIEHRDGNPPKVDECRRYVDFVWYFLKSTDSLLLMKVCNVKFWSPDQEYELMFIPEFEDSWNVTIQGKLPPKDILEFAEPGALDVDVSCERPNYTPPPIYGRWNPTQEQLIDFARKYFALSGYWWEDHV